MTRAMSCAIMPPAVYAKDVRRATTSLMSDPEVRNRTCGARICELRVRALERLYCRPPASCGFLPARAGAAACSDGACRSAPRPLGSTRPSRASGDTDGLPGGLAQAHQAFAHDRG